jgi:signal transduction histidine kinase
VALTYTDTQLILSVQDEGMGIPPNDLAHLFQPFQRATNVSAIGGTGLGLVIVKEAVELHDGTITVTSQLGVGTTFTVTIPTLPAASNEQAV